MNKFIKYVVLPATIAGVLSTTACSKKLVNAEELNRGSINANEIVYSPHGTYISAKLENVEPDTSKVNQDPINKNFNKYELDNIYGVYERSKKDKDALEKSKNELDSLTAKQKSDLDSLNKEIEQLEIKTQIASELTPLDSTQASNYNFFNNVVNNSTLSYVHSKDLNTVMAKLPLFSLGKWIDVKGGLGYTYNGAEDHSSSFSSTPLTETEIVGINDSWVERTHSNYDLFQKNFRPEDNNPTAYIGVSFGKNEGFNFELGYSVTPLSEQRSKAKYSVDEIQDRNPLTGEIIYTGDPVRELLDKSTEANHYMTGSLHLMGHYNGWGFGFNLRNEEGAAINGNLKPGFEATIPVYLLNKALYPAGKEKKAKEALESKVEKNNLN